MFAASQAVVNEATRQFKEIFNTHWVPDPVLTSYRLWAGMDNFGYAYHQWGLNVDDRKVIKEMIEPVENIYVCNESYSDMQGWVNGSLRSADLALEKFGIAPLIDDSSVTPCKESES